MKLPVETPRIHHGPVSLRGFEEGDVDLVRSVADDPYIPLVTTVPTSGSVEDALAYVARQRSRTLDGSGFSLAITDIETGAAVGQIGLWLRDIGQGRASTGYWIAPEFRGHGYLRAALAGLSEIALHVWEVPRLQLFVEPWNEASWRAAEACGFEREVLLRSWQEIGGTRRDMYAYARLADSAAPDDQPRLRPVG
ncbi:GNAT family N-acetyltransferase [Mariniluteicoccus flavus]